MAQIDFDIKRVEKGWKPNCQHLEQIEPPPELVNLREGEQVRVQSNDRRSPGQRSYTNDFRQASGDYYKIKSIPETTKQVVENSPVEEALSTLSLEPQEPIHKSRKSARKTQVSFANDSARLNEDPVEQVPSVADTSVPFLSTKRGSFIS